MLPRPVGFLKRREGQGMAEYALILALVAVAAIAAVALLGPKLQEVFHKIIDAL
jgi:pilus assembly protein Flp/PilA